ncbi:putative disease resistance protein RGA3 isoform X2 [Medicago truncatula]|uniref:NB-ARC domain disease resistance protein n=1 Tax=Medicago truncatula TaxID=3880 RepID=A0A072UUP1_MEDTR|nr:putative disease resistance protein RGA3 isoform X2 [Medicago truncatula]KEH33096.1 NB-ARC domain disease resistance protein [Medicago truncatula]
MAMVVFPGAFLSSAFQVIRERLASTDFKKRQITRFENTLDLLYEVLDDAEMKQYRVPRIKSWLVSLKHYVYELDQLLDVIATDAQQMGKIQRILSGFINQCQYRMEVLLMEMHQLTLKKELLGLKDITSGRYRVRVSQKLLRKFRTKSLIDESVMNGREHEKEELIKFLLSDIHSDNLAPIISIVGLMGMGKTTLAQLVYNDDMITEHFELKAWVNVPESFNLVSPTGLNLSSFHISTDNSEDFEILQHQFLQLLTGKKYLLVLDGVCKIDENTWEELQILLKCGSSGSKMIVTTHDKEVASIMRSTRLIHLKQLEESDSWSLFVRYAFQGRNVFEYPNLELIGKKIVEKCGGLPLALKTLGNLLLKKFSESEWIKVLETDLWRLPEGEIYINLLLRLSYLILPSNLKRCFAYCSIFPKGYELEKGELIKLWMAEGLLKCHKRDKSEQELGNEFFNHLVSISFFQQSVIMPLWADKYYFVMHDLVNDLAKSMAGKQPFLLEEYHKPRARHIWCCLDFEDGDRKLEYLHRCNGLRSLIVDAQGYGPHRFKISTVVQHNLFSRVKLLRMLSFSGCNLLLLDDGIRNLKLLRYLDLSHTEIASLPNSICTHIKKMPTKIERLNNLEMLTDFVVGEQRGFDIKMLGKLNQLHGKLQISGLENVNDPAHAVAANLEDKEHLEDLSMSYNEWREMDGSVTEAQASVLEALQPNINLTSLTIKDYRGGSFPNWLGDRHLPNLVSLELLGCKIHSQLPPLGQFPSLKKCSISSCDGIEIIGTEFLGYNSSDVPFRSLETLRFENMAEWKEWLCLEGFPLLQKLCIKHCPKLKSALPQHLPSLQKLEIIDCQELAASIPKAANITELELKRCDDILINELPSKLKRIILCGTQVIQSTLEQILLNCAFLEELEVEDFFGPNLEWSSLDMCSCNSLRTLTITSWHSSSLPFPLHLFTNLNSLMLYDYPWLESFSGRQLPSNLCSLQIKKCPKLMASREEWGLFQLNSLKQFSVGDDLEILESFPEESLLPSTMKSLELTNCSNLRIINYKGLLHMTSLESLCIEDCPCLDSLPEEGLPSSLSTLSIHDCPLIKQKYQKEEGERWHTISHIPDVTIS